MDKIITENGVKPVVYCKLDMFVEYGSAGKRDVYVAHITRTSRHPVLGAPTVPPNRTFTRTSQVLNIDFQKKQFETLNTVYRWE